MDSQREKQMEEELETLRRRIRPGADSEPMPESLTAAKLFERLQNASEDSSKVIDISAARDKKIRYFLGTAASVAVFILIFSGYYAMTNLTTQWATRQGVQSSAASGESAAAGSSEDAMQAAADYTQIRYAIGNAAKEAEEYNRRYYARYEKGLFGGSAPAASASPQENPVTAGGGMDMAESTARAEGGSGVYETNVQVEGIDESDIVKTDGTNIYFYRFDSKTGNSQITVVRASDLRILSQLDLGGYYATEIYLNGNQLVTVRNASDASARPLPQEANELVTKMTDCEFDVAQPETSSSDVSGKEGAVASASPQVEIAQAPDKMIGIDRMYYAYNFTEAVVYDISDPQNPKEQYRYEQDGSYVSSRLYDGTLYLISNKSIYQDVRYNNTTMGQMVPIAGMGSDGLKLLSPESIVIAPDYCDNSYAVVTALNLKDQKANTKAILGMSSTIYMSYDSLYIAAGKYAYTGGRS
jgi:hypothetical protein